VQQSVCATTASSVTAGWCAAFSLSRVEFTEVDGAAFNLSRVEFIEVEVDGAAISLRNDGVIG